MAPRIISMKNSNDIIGNRTRDLPGVSTLINVARFRTVFGTNNSWRIFTQLSVTGVRTPIILGAFLHGYT